MIFSLLIIIIPALFVLAMIARQPFELTKPAIILTGLGVLGAVMFMIGLANDPTSVDPEGDASMVSVLGTFVSLIAFLGLIALILIWAIRRWGLPQRPERRE